MPEASVIEQLAEVPARVERIIHFDTMASDTGSLPDVLADLLEDERFEQAIKAEFPDVRWPTQKDADEAEEPYWRFRREWMEEELADNNVTGWFVWVSTPREVRRVGGDTKVPRKVWSWGIYVTQVFHGATYEDALGAALAWLLDLRYTNGVRRVQEHIPRRKAR